MFKRNVRRRALRVIGVILAGSVALVASYGVLVWLPERAAAAASAPSAPSASPLPSNLEIQRLKNDIRSSGAQVLFGSVVLAGLYLTWRRIRAVEIQARSAVSTEVTGRFTSAISQLTAGHSVHLRIGGMFALERLAQESEEDCGWTIEMLSVFIRERSVDLRKPMAVELPEEIQFALLVLGRLPVHREQVTSVRAFLERVDLRGAKLAGLDFRHAQLRGSNLTGADLRGTNLVHARLQEATLKKVLGAECDLTRCNLMHACLELAVLNGSKLVEASLEKADCSHVELKGARMSRAQGKSVQLVEASLDGAYLDGATLILAELRNSILNGCDLRGASLTGAKLQGASLRNADLSGACLVNADLQGATLTGANLSHAVLKGARFDGTGCKNAIFKFTDVRGTDLSRAEDLTTQQLVSARTGPDTVFPPAAAAVRS